MKSTIKIAVIASFLTLYGCGGAATDENSPKISKTNQSTSNPANIESTNTNPSLIPYPGTENSNGNIAANSDVKVINVEPKQSKPSNPALPAADNSEMTTVLNEKGAVETRTFKTNPLLVKIERTTYGKEVQVKMYLKNGKTITLPNEKIANFAGDSAETILRAAGIESPKPAPNPNTGAATGSKTEDTPENKTNRPPPTPNAPPIKVPIKP